MARDDQNDAELDQRTIGFITQDDITGMTEFKIAGGGRTVTVEVSGGKDEVDGVRKATTVTGWVVRHGQEHRVGSVSAVDGRGVTFESLDPQTLTFHIPIGCTGIVRRSGGTPPSVLVTQVGL